MEEPSIFLVFFKDSFNNKVKRGLFLNECLDSTMDRGLVGLSLTEVNFGCGKWNRKSPD